MCTSLIPGPGDEAILYTLKSSVPSLCGSISVKVRVTGFDFIGCGEARNKKDAQGIAAREFCRFLVEQGLVDPKILPTPLENVSYSNKYMKY